MEIIKVKLFNQDRENELKVTQDMAFADIKDKIVESYGALLRSHRSCGIALFGKTGR